MYVKLTASALATAALLCGAARSGAQGASRTLDSDTTLTDTAFRDTAEDGGISAPAFFELRLVTSRHSAIPTRMPVAEYRNLYIVDLRAGWTLTSSRFLSVEYAPSIVPLAISTRNPREYVARASVNCVQGKECEDFTALDISTVPLYSNTYGFGLTPVGFQLRLFRSSPVQLLTYANGGALWFTHRIPDPEATRFNFTAELGTAIQVNLPERLGLVVGYSWHHTSNAGTGHVNPGLNSRAISIGIVARRDR
jgi:Lipid A 3-O-deacylase (PagL).